MADAQQAAGFAWETLLRDETEIVRRARVPGGWLVCHLLRSDPPTPASMTFVPDDDHSWRASAERSPEMAADPASAPHAAFASHIVSTGPSGIVTTQGEVDCYQAIRALLTKRDPTLAEQIGFVDTASYFGIYVGSPTRWFARLCITPRTSWIGLALPKERDPSAEDLGGLSLLEANWAAPWRVELRSADDLALIEGLLFEAAAGV